MVKSRIARTLGLWHSVGGLNYGNSVMFVVVSEECQDRCSMDNVSTQEVLVELYHDVIVFWGGAKDDMSQRYRAGMTQVSVCV